MGISLAEYLAQKEACAVCDANGNHQHCVENLLSRVDNCIFYNTFQHRRDVDSANDVILLQEMRSILDPDTVLEYYITAEPIVKKINSLPNPADTWLGIHDTFVSQIIPVLRDRNREEVTNKIKDMLLQLKAKFKLD